MKDMAPKITNPNPQKPQIDPPINEIHPPRINKELQGSSQAVLSVSGYSSLGQGNNGHRISQRIGTGTGIFEQKEKGR